MELHSHCLNELALVPLYFLKTSLKTSLSGGNFSQNTKDDFFELRAGFFNTR
jgi:hypothetical protein